MTYQPFKKKVYLASPTMHGDELKYMADAIEKNWVSTVGENIDEVERQVAEKVGVKYAVCLASGTAALHLAVKCAGLKKGEKVFCADMTFAATVNPVTYEGGEQVFIDTEYETWNTSPEALEKAFELYPDTRLVIVSNLYGTPVRFDEIKAICKKHGATLLEDAAESFGATYKGRQTGGLGDLGVISFNGNKIITGSTGGIFLTNDQAAAASVKKWSTQAKDTAPWYQHSQLGYNYRVSNLVAGIIRGQLPYLEEHIERKRDIFERYKKGFADLPVTMNPYEDFAQPNFWLSCMLIDSSAMCPQERTDTVATYQKQKGKTCPTHILEELAKYNAEGRCIWKPMHLQPIYKDKPFVTKDGLKTESAVYDKSGNVLDVGADIFARGVCLPSDIKMTHDEQDIIIEIIKGCFN